MPTLQQNAWRKIVQNWDADEATTHKSTLVAKPRDRRQQDLAKLDF